jgi:hypothetical protein
MDAIRLLYEEFRELSAPESDFSYNQQIALRFVRRAADLNLAVLGMQGVICRGEKVITVPGYLKRYCWDEVPGETWEEFRDSCKAGAESFLETVPSPVFDLELASDEEWPKLKLRRQEIRQKREQALFSNCEYEPKTHCCEAMTRNVNHQCDQHENPFDCPDNLISYDIRSDEYGIMVHDGGSSCVHIDYCPWCGQRL